MTTSATLTRGGNLFEVETARKMSRTDLVETFVPTPAFDRVLSAKNHVVLGSRGSGKTALARMLAHDHLSLLDYAPARAAIDGRTFIGLYVPLRVTWVGALKNKVWFTEAEQERFFQWRLNIASCAAFLVTLRSCLDRYIHDLGERIHTEWQLLPTISRAWSDDESEARTIDELSAWIRDVDYRRLVQEQRLHAIGALREGEVRAGVAFDLELFAPLQRAIGLASDVIGIPGDAVWTVSLDEAEFLDDVHQRIINTYMRSNAGALVFKLTTLPYAHRTLETNTKVRLVEGEDFDYVYIDREPTDLTASLEPTHPDDDFAARLFDLRRRRDPRYQHLRFGTLLGRSRLLDANSADWKRASRMFTLLERYGSARLVQRAQSLYGGREFKSQVSRKIHGPLLLRAELDDRHGRSDPSLFSGASLIARCSDLNPRRLVRAYNALLRSVPETRLQTKERPVIPVRTQNRVLVRLAASTLHRSVSEPFLGPALRLLLEALGNYMRKYLYERPLTGDEISSVRLTSETRPEIWELVKAAVQVGLIYPHRRPAASDQPPLGEGVFRLAYVFSPYFRLMPRRAHARNVEYVLFQGVERTDETTITSPLQSQLFDLEAAENFVAAPAEPEPEA